ncbi:beta strand repeat-containing protein, partial [Lactiplantibacillus nangangensis]
VIVYGITLNDTDKTLSTTANWDPTTNIKQAVNTDGTTADVTITMQDADGKTVTNLSKPGKYTVTYAIDGYTTTATITVTSQASLDVQGSTLKPGSTWNAKDNFIGGTDENGDALDFSQVTVSGTVNTNKPGSYDVTYSYTDAAGNPTSQTVTITVSDSNASIDAADSAVKVGSTWTAKDNFNSAVNADGTTNVDFKDVTVSGDTVNTKVPGTYNVTYSFTDSTGATISKTVKVVVYGITLTETDKTLSTTNNWDPMTNVKQAVNADGTDAKVTVTMTDADGKTVTSLTKPGVYTITYTSADDSVTATVTITNGATLNVVDSTVKPGSTWNAKDNFIDGTDENGDALDFSQITVTGSVNTNKPGDYKVTYTYTDAAGNETSQTITITVSDTNANIDANDSTLKLGDTWHAEDNFNAAVNADGTTNVAFKDVTVGGDTVNTNVPGTYNVTYTFTDSTGATISKTVKVVVYGITLNETNKEISTTSNWDPTTNVKKATDGTGNELGGSDLAIAITDEAGKTVTSLTKPGTYTVTYSFVTRAGESYTTSATVVVTNKASLNVNDSNLTAGDSWKPADNFVSGTDENGDALDFSQITVTGNVDPNTAGTYKVSYSYTDANGDSITKVITVTVTAKDTDGDGDNGNGNGGTDTDGNGGGDTDTGDNNNGNGNTDTGDTDNNGGGNTDAGNNNNNGSGTDTDENSDGDAINNGHKPQPDTNQSEGDTVVVKPVGTTPANSQAKSAKKVSLKTAAKQVNGQADATLDQLPQTNEQSTNRAATAGVVLLALGGLVLGLGKAVLNRRHN